VLDLSQAEYREMRKNNFFAMTKNTKERCRCSGYRGYPGPPAPGPRHRPIFSPGGNQRSQLWRRPSRGGAS
jgi:hypothetical protein